MNPFELPHVLENLEHLSDVLHFFTETLLALLLLDILLLFQCDLLESHLHLEGCREYLDDAIVGGDVANEPVAPEVLLVGDFFFASVVLGLRAVQSQRRMDDVLKIRER